MRIVSNTKITLFLIPFLLPFVSGCSTTRFIFQAARGQMKLLSKVKPVKEVIKDEKVSEEVKTRLKLLSHILEYSKNIGLNVTNQYQTYVAWDDPNLTYLLTASEKLSLTPKKWSFPVAGEFPYLGFFEKQDAIEKEKEMEGYDTYIRGVRAYSTLGWFPDPMVSTMMNMSKVGFTSMIIHELVHSTVFFKGKVSFNEQLATFFAEKAVENWAEEESHVLKNELEKYYKRKKKRKKINKVYKALAENLKSLYESHKGEEEFILRERKKLFDSAASELAVLYSSEEKKVSPEKLKVNNAVVLANRTYEGNREDFERLFKMCAGAKKLKLISFIEKIKKIDKKEPVKDLKSQVNCD
jgi:predicted aminopeptidase